MAQIMACRLFGAKPLSKQMQRYCQLDPLEQTSEIVMKNTKSFTHEISSEIVVCPGGDEFKIYCIRILKHLLAVQ